MTITKHCSSDAKQPRAADGFPGHEGWSPRVLGDPSPTLVQTKAMLGSDNAWSSSKDPCGLWGLRRCRTRAADVQLPRGTAHITQLQGSCLLNGADFSPYGQWSDRLFAAQVQPNTQNYPRKVNFPRSQLRKFGA